MPDRPRRPMPGAVVVPVVPRRATPRPLTAELLEAAGVALGAMAGLVVGEVAGRALNVRDALAPRPRTRP